jgi:hypothetical protein
MVEESACWYAVEEEKDASCELYAGVFTDTSTE